MTGGGWIIGMAKDSQNKDAAYTLLRHILSPAVSLHLVLMPGTDIFRTSQFSHPVIQKVAPAKYLEVYQESISDNFPELRNSGRIRVLRRARRRGAEGARGRALGQGGTRRGGGQLGADHRSARTRRTA